MATKQKGSDDNGGNGLSHKLSRKSRSSITSLDNQLPISSAISSSDGNYVILKHFFSSRSLVDSNRIEMFDIFFFFGFVCVSFICDRVDRVTVYSQRMICDMVALTVPIV